MKTNKKIFFASDFHLGIDRELTSLERERRIVRWLTEIEEEIQELYLVGDVFDHWFEYKRVIPKGFTRLLGKLADLRDKGIPIYFFTGNHDMWMFNYLTEEMDIPIYREPITRELLGKKFYIGHGDGLGPGDHGYKVIKRIFSNRLCQWLFARIHPNLGLLLMKFFSTKSRESSSESNSFLGPEKEWLVTFTERHQQSNDVDYYVFGHRHLPIEYKTKNGKATYFNLGDWMTYFTYLEFDGDKIKLKSYPDSDKSYQCE